MVPSLKSTYSMMVKCIKWGQCNVWQWQNTPGQYAKLAFTYFRGCSNSLVITLIMADAGTARRDSPVAMLALCLKFHSKK